MAIIAFYAMPHPPLAVAEVGKGQERAVSKTLASFAEAAMEIKDINPDTIVLVSPHSTVYYDYFHISPGKRAKGDFSRFGAPNVVIECNYDTEFVKVLEKKASDINFPAGTMGGELPELDHGTTVPLYFINKDYQNYKLVRIGISGMSVDEHYQMGKLIQETANELERKVVFIASGDLSHKLKADGPYGYAPEGKVMDELVLEAFKTTDFLKLMTMPASLCNSAAECGVRSFVMMAGAMDRIAVNSDMKSYEGPFGVGYAVCGFRPVGVDDSRQFDKLYEEAEIQKISEIKKGEDELVKLARKAAEHYVKNRALLPAPNPIPYEMLEKAGVFVTCRKNGELRGCIGTIYPTANNIASEIIRNAVNAVSEDPRFAPVKESELSLLTYSVDVLGKPEKTTFDKLDPQRYGVIVTSGYKKGLLLPMLDGVDTPQQQLDIALQKGGISKGENYTIERFEVVRHK